MKRQAILAIAALAMVVGASAFAQSSLENPQPASFQSGVGLISGWSCVAGAQVSIDGATPLAVAYGTPRGDVASTCGGNANVGFGLLFNYNTLGAGIHTAQLKVGGTNIGSPVQFKVTVPVGEFAVGLSGTVTLAGFPSATQSTTLQWQQSQQNFAITAVTATTTPPGSGSFPITFKGLRLDGITSATGSSGECNVTLNFANTDTVVHTGFIYFDVVQGGAVKDQVVFDASNVAAGASAQSTTTVVIGQNIVACGAFTLQFNASDSVVF
jgi:hypothetical protein